LARFKNLSEKSARSKSRHLRRQLLVGGGDGGDGGGDSGGDSGADSLRDTAVAAIADVVAATVAAAVATVTATVDQKLTRRCSKAADLLNLTDFSGKFFESCRLLKLTDF